MAFAAAARRATDPTNGGRGLGVGVSDPRWRGRGLETPVLTIGVGGELGDCFGVIGDAGTAARATSALLSLRSFLILSAAAIKSASAALILYAAYGLASEGAPALARYGAHVG